MESLSSLANDGQKDSQAGGGLMSLSSLKKSGKKARRLVEDKKESRLKLLFGLSRFYEAEKLLEKPYFILQKFNVEVDSTFQTHLSGIQVAAPR